MDIRGHRIEPDPVEDSSKLCIYRALSAALYESGTGKSWNDVIADTVLLRKTYPVAFDEDAWTTALPEYYGFKRIASALKYNEVLGRCNTSHTKQDAKPTSITQFFVVGIDRSEEGSGHAIYVEYATTKKGITYRVIDNEATKDTTKINIKLSHLKFNIYRRTDRDAFANADKAFGDKLALISEENRNELTRLITTKE